MRTVLASRLLAALGLGVVGTMGAPGLDRLGHSESTPVVAPPAYDPPAARTPGVMSPSPSARPATTTTPVSPAARPAPKHTAAKPLPRSTVVHRPGTTKQKSAAPTVRPTPKATPKPKPKPPPPPPPPPSGGASTSAYESRILVLVNAQRARNGLSGLSMSLCADSYAERWSVHLAAIGTLEHQSMVGLLNGCSASAVGENVGFGAVSPDTMMAMWMASPGHRANILNPRFTAIGIGAVQTSNGTWYATQDFLDP